MTFVSSMEKPSHKKCHKQSKRGKNSLFKLTMAGLLRKAEGNLGKTNLLKQTIYWSTNIHILQSLKNHQPSSGTKVWAIRNWNPKNQITLVEPVQRDVNYIFTWWAFVVLGDEPVQTRNMAPQKIWFQASLSSWLHREFQLPSTSSSH